MQIEDIEMAGTADTVAKGGGDLIKGFGKPFETSYTGEAAKDIMQAASRGGGIVTETIYMEKAPGVGQLRLAEYEMMTAKLTGVQAFGKIDPQVYLSFIKNVPPEVAGEWLTQMGGLPVSQLSQVTTPINIVMHEVFTLPAATVPAGAIFGGIAGAAVGRITQPNIDVSPVVSTPQKGSTVQPQPVLDVSPSTIMEPKPRLIPHAKLPSVSPIEDTTSLMETKLPSVSSFEETTTLVEPKPRLTLPRITPKLAEWEETSPIVTPEPISKPGKEVSPIVSPEPLPMVIPRQVERTSPEQLVVTPEPEELLKPSSGILPSETSTLQTVSRLPEVQLVTIPERSLDILPRDVTVKPRVSPVPVETPAIGQKSQQETVSPIPTPTPPVMRRTATFRLWGESGEGIRVPDLARLFFGRKYVKRHEIALPSQVAKQALSVSTSSLTFGRQGKRSHSGFGLFEGGTVGSLVFGKSKRGNIFGGNTVGSLIFERSKVSRRRGSRKSLLKGSLAEVVFG
jgi:hypothetical protein